MGPFHVGFTVLAAVVGHTAPSTHTFLNRTAAIWPIAHQFRAQHSMKAPYGSKKFKDIFYLSHLSPIFIAKPQNEASNL